MALVATAPATIARATIAHHSKSFALASRLLGRRLRDQTSVIYTWCRRADDAVDTAPAGRDAIARLEHELASAYAGTARDPVLAAFGEVARARQIPIAYPRELLAGMAMDVDEVTYDTVDDLLLYAWRVAGVIGLMMTHVFGVTDDAALVPAAHLGIAMQLTNICRDVAEDWTLGRLYLPTELLARHTSRRLVFGETLPRYAIAQTRRDLLSLAERYYRSADHGVAALPYRAAIAVRAARAVYAQIGREIAGSGYTLARAVVPTSTKLALVAGAIARGTFRLPRRTHIPTRTLELADVPRL
jgi:phytoene synthase